MTTREELADGFRRLGVAAGDSVMLHASVRAVGPVAGGPDQIHLALRDALSPAGTLVMYAGCPDHVDEVGRGDLSPEQEAEVLAKLPPFDAWTARSARDNGALVEMFRTWPGTRVNEHVTRFAVAGGRADFFLRDQPWDQAMGAGSVLEKLIEADGKILLLGSDHDAVTFLHYVEHVADFPERRIARFQVPTAGLRGETVWRPMTEVDSAYGAHENWPDRFFAEIVDGFLAERGIVAMKVGHADSVLMRARELYEYARPLMEITARRGA